MDTQLLAIFYALGTLFGWDLKMLCVDVNLFTSDHLTAGIESC